MEYKNILSENKKPKKRKHDNDSSESNKSNSSKENNIKMKKLPTNNYRMHS